MNFSKKKIGIAIAFVALLLFVGVSIARAYYTSSSSINILSSLVGDFEVVDGDINILLYKENDNGDYVRVFAVPAVGYTFNDSETNCSETCTNTSVNNSGDCTYTLNSNNTITLNSNKKVTCRFFFDKDDNVTADITLRVLKEDANGTYTYNNKHYSITNNVPSFGYTYTNHYSCTYNSTVTYTAATRSFSVATTRTDECLVYFDKNNMSSDIDVNIYVEEGNNYVQVESIPQNKTYELSQTETSSCVDSNNQNTNATITYTNGYINIESSQKQTCNVYLDLVN